MQFIQLFIFTILLVSIHFLLKKSDLGMKNKGVPVNHVVASVIGINVLLIRNFVFAIGSIVAGAAAFLAANEVGIKTESGMDIILLSIVIV